MGWFLPVAMALGGGVLGAKKNQRAREIEDADRKLASATARYSPWTGMTPNAIRYAGSAFGDIGSGLLSGGLTGASLGSAFSEAPQTPGLTGSETLQKPALGQGFGQQPSFFQAPQAPGYSLGFGDAGGAGDNPWANMFANNNPYSYSGR